MFLLRVCHKWNCQNNAESYKKYSLLSFVYVSIKLLTCAMLNTEFRVGTDNVVNLADKKSFNTFFVRNSSL